MVLSNFDKSLEHITCDAIVNKEISGAATEWPVFVFSRAFSYASLTYFNAVYVNRCLTSGFTAPTDNKEPYAEAEATWSDSDFSLNFDVSNESWSLFDSGNGAFPAMANSTRNLAILSAVDEDVEPRQAAAEACIE